ncbi:hypothetical protein [Roseibium suaedae]|uniref:hypothetical protein n=1 Tax=Roseibium suaedae TaxID=735517 RepID=UPI001114B0C0|nr:hypothetical protein [Roseibium suaedae]
MRIIRFAFLYLIFSSAAASAQYLEYIKVDQTSENKAVYPWNEVYGRVSYAVEFSVVPDDAKRSLESFLKSVVSKSFGNEDGNYVLTLILENGVREVSKRAVVSFTWSEKRFLFFTTSSDISSNISFKGRLTDHFPINSNNNHLQVRLELQKTENAAVNTDTYNDFSDQVGLLSFKALVPAVNVAQSLEVPLGIMAKALNSSRKAELATDVSMSFIDDGSDDPNKVVYSIRGPRGGGDLYNNGIYITVSFDVDPSLVGVFEAEKFKNLNLDLILRNALVGASGAGIPFEEAISGKEYEGIRGYLSSLDQRKRPDGVPSSYVCRELWDTLLGFFSNRDAPVIYAAYLKKYGYWLDASGARSGCIDAFKQSFEGLSVDTTSIPISQ